MRKSKHHIPVLDHLRGVAAFTVAFYHLSCGNEKFLDAKDPIAVIGSYGWLGVEVFFVISGFVVPYSLYLRSYSIGDCLEFFSRRLKRLEPCYLACIVLTIVLNKISTLAPGFQGAPFDLTWQRLLAHLGYLNAILNYEWLSPVFWTLAIEFQYYFFIALVFPLLIHRQLLIRFGAILFLIVLGFAGHENPSLLFFWLPLFAMGMLSFQYYVGLWTSMQFSLLLSFVSVFAFLLVGQPQTLVGLLTALIIVSVQSRELPRTMAPIAFLGTVSYSLYLLHVPIGGRVINLAGRLPESIIYRYPAIILALGITIFCAYVFWLYIELPSQNWSKRTPSSKTA